MILQVSPTDPDQTILSSALELKLLTGLDTKEAQNQLLHPGGRIDAEIGYLPGVSRQEAQAVRVYLQAAEAGGTAETAESGGTAETAEAAHEAAPSIPAPIP